jgi:hypothetical protein
MMNATDFILQKLNALHKTPAANDLPDNVLIARIQQIVLSKKFRKYHANEELISTVHDAIVQSVKTKTPVQFLFPQGGYKLWRLEEAPYADFAELFFLMHVAKPLAEICALYKPGVVFDILFDDLILEKMNNLPLSDIRAYIHSFEKTARFLKTFLPDNFNFKITGISTLFDSEEHFWDRVNKNLENRPLPEITDRQKEMIEMNIKLRPEQADDPKWREKVKQLMDAYMATKREPGYHVNRQDKVLLFTAPLPSGTYVSIGTTKNSIAKHWCGVGALTKKDDAFEMTVLPPSRIPAESETVWEKVSLPGLDSDNFKRIRIL